MVQLCVRLSRHTGSHCAGQQLTGQVANTADIEAQLKDGVPGGESVQTGTKGHSRSPFLTSSHVTTQLVQTVTVTHFKSCVPRSRTNIHQNY